MLSSKNWKVAALRTPFSRPLGQQRKILKVTKKCSYWKLLVSVKKAWGQQSSECIYLAMHTIFAAGSHMFKVNNRNTRVSCEICSKLIIKTPERRQWLLSGFFIVNFEDIWHLGRLFLLLSLTMELPAGF